MAACKCFLYGWVCGSPHEDLAGLKLPSSLAEECRWAADHGLMRYARQTGAKAMEEKCSQKAAEWYLGGYSPRPLGRQNSFNQYHFLYIIADALYLGPLKAQMLAVKCGDATCGLSGKEGNRKIALAVAGQYLQSRGRIGDEPNREFVPIVQAEIGNWVNVRAKSGGTKAKNADGTVGEAARQTSVPDAIADTRVTATGEPLFEKHSMDNCVKIRVNSRWLEACQVRLIPAEAAEQYRQDGFRVMDDRYLQVEERRC